MGPAWTGRGGDMDSGRRQFLLRALGAVGAIAFPNGASAQRRRVLGEASDIRQSPPGGKPDGNLSSWLLSMRVGPAAAQASLLAFWLTAKDQPSKFDITTLDEARRSGTLLITERAQATVPELIVDNRGKVPVLLLAGEILVGGKQNRILIEDVLFPPLSGCARSASIAWSKDAGTTARVSSRARAASPNRSSAPSCSKARDSGRCGT